MGNTILIVDDFEPSVKMLSKFFGGVGFKVYAARTCAEAIKLAGQYHPDCFLLDYHLDEGNTAEPVCSFIRSNEYIRKNPIVIISGDPEQAIYSYTACHADVFVEKGRKYAEVLALLKRQLDRAQWADGVFKKYELTLEASALRLLRPNYPPIQLSPEQFRFFSVLLEKSPDFVPDEEVCSRVFGSGTQENCSAVWSLAYRLRQKLGRQLSRRIKNSRRCGWIYVQPRLRAGRARSGGAGKC